MTGRFVNFVDSPSAFGNRGYESGSEEALAGERAFAEMEKEASANSALAALKAKMAGK